MAHRSRLVVLGTCGAWPEPGRACSGYLLEHEGFRVLLDLGYGALPRLLEALGSHAADGLDAVVVSHRHPDHVIDLHGLFRARSFGNPDAPPIPLHAPDGVLDKVKALEDGDGAKVDEVFTWHRLPAGPRQVGPFRLESRELHHSVPNVGVRLAAETLSIAYTGDTGLGPGVAELGRGADLFIVEATDQSQQQPELADEPGTHLAAAHAAEVAARSGARRVLLTHFWPGTDREATRAAVERAAADLGYDGELLVAGEGAEIFLP